jgi:drug/metabolite transporter (DMT)-like permease
MISMCSYVGLQEVSFPVALMSKSCKLIVVMVGGVLLLGKKYQMRDYLAASAIVAGLFIFQQDSAKSGSSTLFGILVLLLSLTFDSLNSNYNEKVVSVNRCNRLRLQYHPIAISCMCRCDVLRVFAQTNFIACIMSAVCVIVSGVQSLLLHVDSLKRASAGELHPSLVAFAEQPMCLALLILMNIFLCVPVPTAPFVTKSTLNVITYCFPHISPDTSQCCSGPTS